VVAARELHYSLGRYRTLSVGGVQDIVAALPRGFGHLETEVLLGFALKGDPEEGRDVFARRAAVEVDASAAAPLELNKYLLKLEIGTSRRFLKAGTRPPRYCRNRHSACCWLSLDTPVETSSVQPQ
jgi:hypothetical protein